MKKSALLLILLPALAVAGFTQESRQDASLSVTGIFPPYVSGNAVQLRATISPGALASYRYMLTPRSAAELNYQYTQDAYKSITSFLPNYRVHVRMQEASGAYVFNFNFKHFNPFLEAGVGGFFFTPLKDASTSTLDPKSGTSIGAIYGGGVAYEISPSFDIRAQYRGIVVKAPGFGVPLFQTNRYFNINNPTIGVAYHF